MSAVQSWRIIRLSRVVETRPRGGRHRGSFVFGAHPTASPTLVAFAVCWLRRGDKSITSAKPAELISAFAIKKASPRSPLQAVPDNARCSQPHRTAKATDRRGGRYNLRAEALFHRPVRSFSTKLTDRPGSL